MVESFKIVDPNEVKSARHAHLIGGLNRIFINGKAVRGQVVRMFRPTKDGPWEVDVRLPDPK